MHKQGKAQTRKDLSAGLQWGCKRAVSGARSVHVTFHLLFLSYRPRML